MKINHKTEKRVRRHERIRSTIAGTPTKPRLSVFRSNTALYLQLIDDSSGKTLVSASTKEVKSGTVIEKAVQAGKLVAEKASGKNIKSAVFDRGGFLYTGRVKAAAEGAREGGLKF